MRDWQIHGAATLQLCDINKLQRMGTFITPKMGCVSLQRAHIWAPILASCVAYATAAGASYKNAAGIPMVQISGGSFTMGYSVTPLPANLTLSMANRLFGYTDEFPYIEQAVEDFWASATEITNYQYELFDPSHAKFRGDMGFSIGDNESVVFVTYNDTVAYTAWLSAQENETYRLPSEIEAEYYIRAGTTTYYNTGNYFPYGKNQCDSWWPANETSRACSFPVNLTVATFPPNAYGLFDTHGNVEEWTSDWVSDKLHIFPFQPTALSNSTQSIRVCSTTITPTP
jgi:formylglycine-generating enzyme required for sulfatase activity